jgi:hypothetical protein
VIANLIKSATCRIACGTESGTGWLIAPGKVITARHCVMGAIDSKAAIELFFPHGNGASVSGKVLADSAEQDSCLLTVDENSAIQPLMLSGQLPSEGEQWQTFGYPIGKTAIGHRLSGNVAQVSGFPKLKIDMDLSVAAEEALTAYDGMSGGTIVCDGRAVGVIRLKLDRTVAGISLKQLQSFLKANGITLPQNAPAPEEPPLADRGTFQEKFTKALHARIGNYLFLEGAHGYGKSTFCAHFRTDDKALVNLGAYCILSPDSTLGADYRAQPPIFVEWLATAVTGLLTGQTPRKEEKGYPELVRTTEQYLEAFSEYCARSKRHGVLFLDGLNEVTSAGLLSELVGLLPLKLPAHVTVVLTAPNYAALAVAVGSRVTSGDVHTLPPLSDAACAKHCARMLKPERRQPPLIDRICAKAKGHPLYLRYLIEHANQQPADDTLADFPVLSGPIEDYYLGIWAKLLADDGAVNVLALIARLRTGILVTDFTKVLTVAEQGQFVSVLSRIRHLLARPDRTTIYHSSFAAFILAQTAAIDTPSYRRLADFCQREPKVRYCVFNGIYHLLRVDDDRAFAACDQAWIDSAVLLGAEPDALLSDVADVLKRAVLRAPADEIFRLMLLSQRITFRYDTLFALSARSIAEALISIGRPWEALQHVLRQKTLIVGSADALEIGFLLHRYNHDREALALLSRVEDRLMENYNERMRLDQFLQLCSWHIQTVFLARLANGESGMKQAMTIMELAHRACAENIKDPDEADRYLRDVDSASAVYFLTFRDEYAELARLKERITAGVPPRVFPILCTALLQFENSVDAYDLPKPREALAKLFADLAELASSATMEPALAEGVTDSLVRFGAPTSVVQLFGSKGGLRAPPAIKIKATNGVDVDFRALNETRNVWRVAAFLDPQLKCPEPGAFYGGGWLEALERVVGALYWCDGRGRRARADGDEAARVACRDQLKQRVIDPLLFTLRQRAQWKDSYAIPENLLPRLYRQLAEVLFDCFPAELPGWLDNLATGAEGQWGLYTEGFRRSAYSVVHELMREKPSDQLTPLILKLLHSWRDHVLRGVENRHELVPEILSLMPHFSELGAHEEAERLYAHLLSVSMGPSWYKEDQLGLMVDALGSLKVSPEAQARIPQIAGYLERASGEMTFQRYVRAEKGNLVGQMVRQGKYRAAVAYFRRQSCGSPAELWADAQQGTIDRLSSLQGQRFPGGALEEQAAVLAMVRNATTAPWALRWALLEIFFCGDERHLTDYASEFAKLANEAGAREEIIQRATFVAVAETPTEERGKFALSFKGTLRGELHAAFAAVLSAVPPPQPAPLAPPPPPASAKATKEEGVDEDDARFESMRHAGFFGRRKALDEAEKIQAEARRQKSLGNTKASKEMAAKMLRTAQDGGWGIWGNLSESARDAEALLVEGETDAAAVIRHYAPMLDAERHAAMWHLAQHLIGRVGNLLKPDESQQLLDSVIQHIRLMVGDAATEIQKFQFLADSSGEEGPGIELFRMIVWLCDHPEGLRRDRAAAMLLWLYDVAPELGAIVIKTAFSMEEGYGADVLCGVLDGASASRPVPVWDEVEKSLDVPGTVSKLNHLSRRVALLRLATRAGDEGSVSAKQMAQQLRKGFTGKRQAGGTLTLPPWAAPLASQWRQLESLMDKDAVVAWGKAMGEACAPVSISDARLLEESVSTCFRESDNRPLNRWKSKLRYALNVAMCSRASANDAEDIEAILRVYNPSLPEKTIQPQPNPVTERLLAAIESGDFSAVLTKADTVLLNYHDNRVNADEDGATHVEVLCVMLPTSKKRGFFAPKLEQTFLSRELPRPAASTTPVETCCRLEPRVVFFGSYTPAIQLPMFQTMVGAKESDFVRQTWRIGRRHQLRGFGQPQQEGCSLSIPRKSVKVPAGLKLAWMVWLDGNLTAFVDEHNGSLI